MTYVHDKSKSNMKQDKILDKGFEISKEDKSRAVAVDHVIDTNKRGKDGIEGGEPAMTE